MAAETRSTRAAACAIWAAFYKISVTDDTHLLDTLTWHSNDPPSAEQSDVAPVGKQQAKDLANTLREWNQPYVLTKLKWVDYADKELTNALGNMAAGYTQMFSMINDGLCIHTMTNCTYFCTGL